MHQMIWMYLNFFVYKDKYLLEHSSPTLIQVECPLLVACFEHDVDTTQFKKKLCDRWTYILECIQDLKMKPPKKCKIEIPMNT